MELALLDYCYQISSDAQNWWYELPGNSPLSRRGIYNEYRLRYEARRSIAQLDKDAKDKPFPRSSNIGIGVEQIFGEFLIPTFLANTHDLEPTLQAVERGTGRIDQALTAYHDSYQREWFMNKRVLLEESCREILTVGGCFHKYYWASHYRQIEVPVYVFSHPLTGPVQVPDPGTGQMDYMYADPNMPKDMWPVGSDGVKLQIQKIPSAKFSQVYQGPRLALRPYEAIEFPPGETRVDPNEWDYLVDNFSVSALWFLGREGDPFEGKFQNLDKLYEHYKVKPDDLAQRPDKRMTEQIPLKEFHMKFPVTKSGRPAEIIATVAVEPRLLLGWRLSPFVRRPYFNRQVRVRKDSPLGVGIPETVWGLRNAIDATLNQELDHGNIYGHPPVLMSSSAMLEDEDYELIGPGTQWVMSGNIPIQQAAMALPMPPRGGGSIDLLNWLVGNTQRIWGVTDLNLNAPTSALSPNISTATAAVSVMNQGNIKFGHLVKRLSEVDTKEFDFQHEMWRAMMSIDRVVEMNGTPLTVKSQEREKFFREGVMIRARGDGLSTNPILRDRTLSEAYAMFANDPFIGGDQEVRKDLLEQILSVKGIRLNLKEPDEMKFLQMVSQLMRTPVGQQAITQGVGQAMQVLQAQVAQQGGGQNGNGTVSASV